MAMIASISHGRPAKCTGRIACVRGVMAASIAAGSMHCVAGSTSVNTGVSPAWMIAFTDAQNVMGVVMTSAPGSSPAATMLTCSAAVQELTAATCDCCKPWYAAKSRSNCATRGPVPSHADSMQATTSSISACSISGEPKIRKGRSSGLVPRVLPDGMGFELDSVFMYRIALQPIHPQPCEALEIAVECTQCRTVFNRDCGEMRIADEVATALGADQQASGHGCVSVGRSDDSCAGVRKPFVHHAQGCVQWQGRADDARLRAQPQKSRQRMPSKRDAGEVGKRILDPACRDRTLRRVQIDRVHQHVYVRSLHSLPISD